jgi:hypothetical protein
LDPYVAERPPRSVVQGIQLTLGVLLVVEGLRFMATQWLLELLAVGIYEGLIRGGLAQIPLTATNAILATAALLKAYWPERPKEEGVTVFLTTHYLEEAERLCDQIALIVEGRITFGNVHLPARLPFQLRRMRREYPLKGRL